MIEPRSRKDLVALDAQGQQVTYLYFWGHQPLPTGEIGRSCLSQWWPSAFTVDGATYPSSEHWMMANKARLFGDEETAAKIVTAEDPKAAKALGREVLVGVAVVRQFGVGAVGHGDTSSSKSSYGSS